MIGQFKLAARWCMEFNPPNVQNIGRISSFFAILLIIYSASSSATAQAPVVPNAIGVTDAIISDPNTGLALFGYDPVDYFIKGRAIEGRKEITLEAQGLNWRFSNRGNLEAFRASPQTYIPRFGGYDALDIAAGRLVAGSPEIFTIFDQQLVFFRSEKSREAFRADSGAHAKASANWPVLSRSLVQPKP